MLGYTRNTVLPSLQYTALPKLGSASLASGGGGRRSVAAAGHTGGKKLSWGFRAPVTGKYYKVPLKGTIRAPLEDL